MHTQLVPWPGRFFSQVAKLAEIRHEKGSMQFTLVHKLHKSSPETVSVTLQACARDFFWGGRGKCVFSLLLFPPPEHLFRVLFLPGNGTTPPPMVFSLK